VIAAFLANFGIACAKFVGFVVTGSASMLAEAVHSVADTGNQGLLLLGGQRAQRAPDATHPFGYGGERYFWAFVVAVVLFALGSLFSIYEGVSKLRHPHEIVQPEWAIGILVVAMGLESIALRAAAREGNALRGNDSWFTFVRKAKSPEIPVVLLEDFGAVTGLVFALAGIGLAVATGDPRFDAMGGLAIGVLLGAIAIILAIEMKSLLIGEAADPAQLAQIRTCIAEAPHIRRIIDLRTLHLGPDQLLVAGKVELSHHLSFAEVARALNDVEQRIRARVPIVRHAYLEPELSSDAVPDPLV
jgi:cation diffusion facilitator family transporter